MRVDRLRAAYDIDIQFVQFPLHPDTPAEGLTLEQLFSGRGVDISTAQVRMAQLMAEEGLPYGVRTMTYNSRLAQELAKWAETQPNGEGIHDALFKAYFVEGLNLASVDNLVATAKKIGLDDEVARDALAQRRFQHAVDADWQHCRQLGVTGVPTFVIGSQAILGAQSYEVLERLLLAVDVRLRHGG